MFTSKNIISLIQESLDGLYNSSMIDSKIFVSEETELFGGQSNIDSMCFVALITDVEDRLCRLTEKDIFIGKLTANDSKIDRALGDKISNLINGPR